MKIAALIIGIDGYERYTRPLVESIRQHEPDCQVVVIDNASQEPYPAGPYVHRTERLCYAAAINQAASFAPEADWYIVLSNDVLCTGPFAAFIEALPDDVVCGPEVYSMKGIGHFVMGWCVVASRPVWEALDGWDENYLVSSWEDVDFSVSAVRMGYRLALVKLPFIHLDQRQRFSLPEFAGTHEANRAYFERKHLAESYGLR